MQGITGIDGPSKSNFYKPVRASRNPIAHLENEDSEFDRSLAALAEGPAQPAGTWDKAREDSSTLRFAVHSGGRQYAKRIAYLNDKISLFVMLNGYLEIAGVKEHAESTAGDSNLAEALQAQLREKAQKLVTDYQDHEAAALLNKLESSDLPPGAARLLQPNSNLAELRQLADTMLRHLEEILTVNRQLYEAQLKIGGGQTEQTMTRAAAGLKEAILGHQERALGGQANQDGAFAAELLGMN